MTSQEHDWSVAMLIPDDAGTTPTQSYDIPLFQDDF